MTMFGVTDLTTYVLGVIFIVLLPGPNSLYVLSVAAQRGVRAGYVGACGIFVGDAVLMVLTALGAASLLQTTPALFFTVKYAGAAYLGWIGLNLLREARRKWKYANLPHTSQRLTLRRVDASQPFRKALLISLLNPKAILFFVSFFIQFVDPDYPHPGLTFIVLGIIVQFFSALYLSILIIAGVRLAEAFRTRRRLTAGVNGGVGTLFIGFGAKLATASLGS